MSAHETEDMLIGKIATYKAMASVLQNELKQAEDRLKIKQQLKKEYSQTLVADISSVIAALIDKGIQR